jgi:hypothetical protein
VRDVEVVTGVNSIKQMGIGAAFHTFVEDSCNTRLRYISIASPRSQDLLTLLNGIISAVKKAERTWKPSPIQLETLK